MIQHYQLIGNHKVILLIALTHHVVGDASLTLRHVTTLQLELQQMYKPLQLVHLLSLFKMKLHKVVLLLLMISHQPLKITSQRRTMMSRKTQMMIKKTKIKMTSPNHQRRNVQRTKISRKMNLRRKITNLMMMKVLLLKTKTQNVRNQRRRRTTSQRSKRRMTLTTRKHQMTAKILKTTKKAVIQAQIQMMTLKIAIN